MKRLTVATVVALGLLAGHAFADDTAAAGACYTISDPDYRAKCRAKAHRDPGICYAIQKQDVRAMCLAEIRK